MDRPRRPSTKHASPTKQQESSGKLFKQHASLKILGEYLGLSPATISLVINNAPGAKAISEPTRLRVLAAAKKHLGSLDRVTRVVRLGVFIATSGDFFDQPRVADAVSDLFRDVFGIERTSVRLVIGVASLPLGMPIELEVIFEVAESTAVDGPLEAERV